MMCKETPLETSHFVNLRTTKHKTKVTPFCMHLKQEHISDQMSLKKKKNLDKNLSVRDYNTVTVFFGAPP